MLNAPQLQTVVTPRGLDPPDPDVVPGATYHLETVVVPRKPKHLEFIQQAINRVDNNSILLKGWTIILTATLLGLFSDDQTANHIFMLSLPVLGFWVLDGIFESRQRLLQALHDRVRRLPESEIDFTMDLSIERQDPKNRLFASMFFSSLGLFYGPLVVIVFVTAGLLSVSF